MKTIGLLGGMSWESTEAYYRAVNEWVKKRRGGLHSAKLVLYSLDFQEIEQLQHANKWDEAALILIDGAQRLERAGADFLVLCTNTMHKLADRVEAAVQIRLLHIADACAEEIQSLGMSRIALLGTKFTMEQDFYRARLESRYGLDVRIPSEPDRDLIHRVIYDELCLGEIRDDSRNEVGEIIRTLVEEGAEGVLLACTELGLLVRPADVEVELFDTTAIHAQKAVDWALG